MWRFLFYIVRTNSVNEMSIMPNWHTSHCYNKEKAYYFVVVSLSSNVNTIENPIYVSKIIMDIGIRDFRKTANFSGTKCS